MNDIEYDIIDELYFVTPYSALEEQLDYSENDLKVNLLQLVKRGLVRVYEAMDEESEIEKIDLSNNFKSYCYLASKKGLFEHNTR